MKAAVVVFPGLNRDRDMIAALTKIGGEAPAIVWHKDAELPKVDLIVIPGGFSYGDYLRAGAIAARSPLMQTIRERAEQGVKVLGVCNGFQILTEAQLLPGVLMRNASLKFVCREIKLSVIEAVHLLAGLRPLTEQRRAEAPATPYYDRARHDQLLSRGSHHARFWRYQSIVSRIPCSCWWSGFQRSSRCALLESMA